MIPPLTSTVTVDLPIERAFALFTGSLDTWWPHEFHLGQVDAAEIVLEPGVGGRWFERGVDGVERDWGRVLIWEPPHRVVFTWQINGFWQFDPDPAHASEIEVRFTAQSPGVTTLVVDHRFFDRLVQGQTIRDAITGGGSWKLLLDVYVEMGNR